MEVLVKKEKISIKKTLSKLDELVFKFSSILIKSKIDFVIVSGYVAIVFGRSRTTEDIDVLIERITRKKFNALLSKLTRAGFFCVNANKEDSWNCIRDGIPLRFGFKSRIIPNFEVKFVKTHLERYTLTNKVALFVNKKKTYMSPLELQIPFKLKLGSIKDLEDARYLYKIFSNKLDKIKLKKFIKLLGVEKEAREWLEAEI